MRKFLTYATFACAALFSQAQNATQRPQVEPALTDTGISAGNIENNSALNQNLPPPEFQNPELAPPPPQNAYGAIPPPPPAEAEEYNPPAEQANEAMPEQNVSAEPEQQATMGNEENSEDTSAEAKGEEQDCKSSPESSPLPPASVETQSSVSDKKPLSPEEALISSLIARNPFGGSGYGSSGGSSQTTGLEAPKGLEFRSVYCIDRKWSFGIYDGATKKHYTIPLGSHDNEDLPYIIDFYDDETNSISISDKLGTYTLTIKTPDRPTGPVPNMTTAQPVKKAPPPPPPAAGKKGSVMVNTANLRVQRK